MSLGSQLLIQPLGDVPAVTVSTIRVQAMLMHIVRATITYHASPVAQHT